MKKLLLLFLCVLMGGSAVVEAGEFRIAPPQNMRRRPPPPGYRESRLVIINQDDRGYAIDVDYRRNRLELVHRARGDIFVPGNGSVVLTFDDDDNWHIIGDHEVLDIDIRAGRTTTLRLETRFNRGQVAIVGSVESGSRRYSKQLFRFSNRPSRPPPPPVHRPTPPPPPPPIRPPVSRPPQPPRPGPDRNPPRGNTLGTIVGDIIDGVRR